MDETVVRFGLFELERLHRRVRGRATGGVKDSVAHPGKKKGAGLPQLPCAALCINQRPGTRQQVREASMLSTDALLFRAVQVPFLKYTNGTKRSEAEQLVAVWV